MQSALYRMSNNKYLGNCLAVVTDIDAEHSEQSGFTRPQVVTLIKVPQHRWREVTNLSQLKSLDLFDGRTPMLRVGSECMFGIFGDTHCDCEQERRLVLREMRHLHGIFVHLPQEGQGMGLFYKAQELHLQTTGYKPDGAYVGEQTQADAAKLLTGDHSVDQRDFAFIAQLLDELGLRQYEYKLVSRSPAKQRALTEAGVSVVGLIDAMSVVSPENLGEYLTKWLYKSYTLSADQSDQILGLLEGTEEIPVRAANLVNEARLALTAGSPRLTGLINGPESLRDRLLAAIHRPSNPSLDGTQSHLLTLLENATAYDEFQYEYILDDELDDYVVQNLTPDGNIRLWYEKNNYFYLPSMGEGARDLKIRTTYDVTGKFVVARLIHKVRLAPHLFRIRTIDFSDAVIADLLKQSVFSDYDQRVVESVTNPFVYTDGGLKIIIKRYTSALRTLSIEGTEQEVRTWRQQAEDTLNRRLDLVPVDERSFAPKVEGTFSLREFRRLEFERSGRYSGI